MGPSRDDDDVISAINVTPLVDIFLVLLIIFIATSAIIVRASINADLPRAATAEEIIPEHVSIVLDREGILYLDGEPITEALLAIALREAVAENPDVRALIAAHRELQYSEVIDVIDQVRGAGFAGYSLNVERETSE
jgi:biopolymer transport protein ExbD